MNRNRVVVCLAVLGLCAQAGFGQAPPAGPGAKYDVKTFGASGDGKTKDTAAFQKALDTCAVNGGGEVVVPAGNYLIGSVQMGTRTTLRLEKDSVLVGSGDAADYPTIDIRWEGRWQPGRRALIYAANVDHIGIVGPGRIEGNAQMAAPQNPRGSVVLEPISCTDVHWEDFSVQQGGNWATHPTYCTDMVIKNINIQGNRDGIDVDSCKNVRIEGCTINTGDDSISIKSGRGMDGARIGKPTEDVLVTNCTLTGRNFACVGIGSETSGGVHNLRIEHCKMTARTQAIYIKTRIGRAGVNDTIAVDDIDVLGGGLLRINLISSGNVNTADDPVQGLIGYPTLKAFSLSNARLNNATVVAEVVAIAPERPIEGLTLSNITGTAQKGITMMHVKGAVLKDINVTVANGPLLAIDDVTGSGLEKAEKYVAPPPAPARGAGARGGRGFGRGRGAPATAPANGGAPTP
jgi:polygalacturonase